MLCRCLYPNSKQFKDYGGRGITVCQEWLRFSTFLEDVGVAPAPHLTLDRVDNNKGYEPGNVRWATRSEQSRNKRYKPIIDRDPSTGRIRRTLPCVF